MKFETVLLENAGIQLIDGDRGKNYPKQSDFKNSGHCLFLSAKNVTKTGFKFEELSYIDSERDKLLRAGKLERGDIVVTTRGTIGNIAFYDESLVFEHIRINSGMMIFRVQDSRWNKRFLYFLLQSPYIQSQIESLTSGSAVPQLPARDLKKFSLPNIPIDVQDKIEKIIFSFTAKLEKNSQINQTLEQIAQAIFKSWFVDFEPVKAKIAAREALIAEYQTQSGKAPSPQEIAEVEKQAAIAAIAGAGDIIPTAQLQTLADLFSNQLVESELGEIPEGWEIKISGEEFDVRDGTHDSPKKSETGFPLVTSKHITTGVLRLEDAYLISADDYEKVNKRSAVESGDILLTMIGTVGIPYLVMQKEINFAIKNVGLFKASGNNLYKHYFYLLLKTDLMQSYLEARIAGTTQKYLSLKTLRNIEFVAPKSIDLVEAFNTTVAALMQHVYDNIEQNYSLSGLRDTLLPKLLSGEIELQANQKGLANA